MTVSSSLSKKDYVGDGSTQAFPTEFQFFTSTDLQVYTIDTNGVVTLRSEGFGSTQYQVSGGAGSSGTVTFNSAPINNHVVLLLRVLPQTQLTDYVDGDSFPAQAHESAIDRAIMLVQQLQGELNLSLKAPSTEVGDPLVLPSISSRALKFLAFDVNGLPISASVVDSATVSAFMTGVLTSADAEAAKEALEIVEYGAIAGTVTVSNSDYTITADDKGKVIRMNALSATNRTVTLPSVSPTFNDLFFTVKKVVHSSAVVRLVAPPGTTIDGQQEFHLTRKGEFVTLVMSAQTGQYMVLAKYLVPHTTVYNAGATHTFLPGRQIYYYKLVGAGGGAGGVAATGAGESAASGGGGSGEVVEGLTQITATTATVVVGIGGAGATGNATGTQGQTTSISGIASAGGGQGGAGGANSAGNTIQEGGAGGTGGSNTITPLWTRRFPGNHGGTGMTLSTSTPVRVPFGHGADGPDGGGGKSGNGANGQNGFAPGAGGGGASSAASSGTTRDGGDGANGQVVIVEY